MAIRKVKLNDSFIYINDEVDEKETGIAIDNEDDDKLGNTMEIEPITDEDLLSETSIDLFGGNDNE